MVSKLNFEAQILEKPVILKIIISFGFRNLGQRKKKKKKKKSRKDWGQILLQWILGEPS
jgi:hypothetical protein